MMSKVEEVSFYSKILGKDVQMAVYLPEGYNVITPLPVLYFLHGRSGDEHIMFDLEINTKADSLISNGEIGPMIIVCPRIENSRGLNSSLISEEVPDAGYGNGIINLGRYEDYFMDEVVPLIDNKLNTIKDRNGRYVGGASAGGYAALHYAFRHQDMFSKVGGHMPAIGLELTEEDRPYFKDMDVWDKYDPICIARNNRISNDLCVYLDAGDKDEGRFYEGCSVLYKILEEKGVNSENHVFSGHHNAEYMKSNMEKYLIFYNKH